jgi:hypothetical protein
MKTLADLKTALLEGAIQRVRSKLKTTAALFLSFVPIKCERCGKRRDERIAAPMTGSSTWHERCLFENRHKPEVPMKLFTITMTLLFAVSTNFAFAANKSKSKGMTPMAEMTTEQRQEMATAHEKMATCLRSDKSMEDCKKDMMQTCHTMMGKGGCPMMGKMQGMMGKGMMHDQEKMPEDESGKDE